MINNLSSEIAENLLNDFFLKGYHIARSIISEGEIQILQNECFKHIEAERRFYCKNGSSGSYGRIFTCVAYGSQFLSLFLNENFYQRLILPLNDPYPILHVFTTSSVPPFATNIFREIHTDSKYPHHDFLEGVGCLVMLSDFTEENGATMVLSGSHKHLDRPSEDDFNKNACRILGKAGDVLIFHPKLWHRSAPNNTSEWRHSLSIGISRPWLRPHVDHVRALKDKELIISSSRLKQLIGCYSLPYFSVEDYYERS